MNYYSVSRNVVQIVDSENQLGKPSGATPAEDALERTPATGSDDSSAGKTRQRLFPEMRRPKPNQEAIAAALQAMQRLTMKMDSESAAEESAVQAAPAAFIICSSCGHKNREANKFCGMCGLPVEASTDESRASELPELELPNFGLPVPASPGFEDEPPPVSKSLRSEGSRARGASRAWCGGRSASLSSSLPSPLFSKWSGKWRRSATRECARQHSRNGPNENCGCRQRRADEPQ